MGRNELDEPARLSASAGAGGGRKSPPFIDSVIIPPLPHKAADGGAVIAVDRPDQRGALLVRIVDDGIVRNIDPHGLDLLAVPGSLVGFDVDRNLTR